jgi:beta-glucosidase
MRSHRLLLATLILLSAGVALAAPPVEPQPSSAARPAAVHPADWPAVDSPLPADPELEAAVGALLAEMSVEEKVGQLIQAEIQHVTPDEVRRYRLGSVLNGGGSWPGGQRNASPADWLALADAFWDASTDTTGGGRGIPVLWGSDAVHGHGNVIGATLFPHNVGLGAARDPELLRRIGRVVAREVSVTGLDWTFGPTVAVARDDRWGRTYESWSEDPEIVRAYAEQIVLGLQGVPGEPDFLVSPHILATAKHFLADGGTAGGKDQGDARISERELREIHLPGYVGALEAGVQTVMASFSSWNGEKMHGHRGLLTGVLKDRMGFDGLLVGDWNGHGQVPGCTNASCAAAVEAGIDLLMVPEDWKALYENTLAQVRSGDVAPARLDDAVRRVLRVKMRAGLIGGKRPSERPLAGRVELLGAPEHRAVARQAVRQSLVLLKNDGALLPLAPDLRVLVAGDGAHDIGRQSGGWTITWQGTGNGNADFPGATSIWDGIRGAVEAAGGTAVLSADGRLGDAEAFRGAPPDVAIVVYGEEPYAEFQGDRTSIEYRPGDKRDLGVLRRLREAGIPVVSVFLTGRPLWVNPEINASDAFVVAWLPGTEGGGVADLLFRAPDRSIPHDFRGRLSFSWPKRVDQVVLNRGDADYDPLFAYGYGLSYLDRIDLPELSEEGAATAAASADVFFAAGPVAPWQVVTGGAGSQIEVAPAGSAVRHRLGGDRLYFLLIFGARLRDLARTVAARELRRLLPGRPQHRLVHRRCLAVRLEHRLRAPGRPGRHRRRERRGRRAVRDPRLVHPAAARLGVRVVLPAQRRLHHAGVPRAALLAGARWYLAVDLDHRLRADEDLGDDRRRRHRVPGADGHRLLDGRADRRRRHRHLHHLRRPARRARHGHAADVRADRRRDRGAVPRAERGRRLGRDDGPPRPRRSWSLWKPADRPRLPVDRHPLRRADPRRLVLVHRPVHRAAHAGRAQPRTRRAAAPSSPVPQAAAAVHLRDPGRHRLRSWRSAASSSWARPTRRCRRWSARCCRSGCADSSSPACSPR